ncbi:MAG: hypothetical protein JWP00_2829 [Chloroflexi bacterium]|jgi:hypothetical protein|nr:hypothetical protein [Chloroflexota bacterium]
MEKMPSNLPDETTGPTTPNSPRLVKPSSGRIWFMAVMFFLPLVIMIIFAIVFFAIGLQTR